MFQTETVTLRDLLNSASTKTNSGKYALIRGSKAPDYLQEDSLFDFDELFEVECLDSVVLKHDVTMRSVPLLNSNNGYSGLVIRIYLDM